MPLALLAVLLLMFAAPARAADAHALDLVPWPARVEVMDGALSLGRGLVVHVDAAGDPRIRDASSRVLAPHGVRIVADATAPRLSLRAHAPSRAPWPTLDDDERYTIAAAPVGGVVGALVGQEVGVPVWFPGLEFAPGPTISNAAVVCIGAGAPSPRSLRSGPR